MEARSPRAVAWSKPAPLGAEFVQVRLERDELGADGVALGSVPLPYRLDYALETTARFVTTRLVVTVRGDGWTRSLELRRRPTGTWEEKWEQRGVPRAALARTATDLDVLDGALDVDLGLSPLFNTMPVLRHDLVRRGGSADFVMAWVSVPDLGVHRSPQRYSFVHVLDDERSIVRFESLAGDGFAADLTYDAAGLVLEYPGIGSRVA